MFQVYLHVQSHNIFSINFIKIAERTDSNKVKLNCSELRFAFKYNGFRSLLPHTSSRFWMIILASCISIVSLRCTECMMVLWWDNPGNKREEMGFRTLC